MNGVENLTRRVEIDMGDIPEYKYARREIDLSYETVRLLRKGKGVSLRNVQIFADHTGIPGPAAFIDPRDDITPELYASDFAYIPYNIERMRREWAVSVGGLAAVVGMETEKLQKITSSMILATTTDIQAIADAMGVKITDLMLPPTPDKDGTITHKRHLPENVIIQVNRLKLHKSDVLFDNSIMMKVTRDTDTARMTAVNEISEKAGIGIAELFINPGIQTEWFKESKASYFCENMSREMDDQEMTNAEMARIVEVSEITIGRIKTGRLPMVRTTQLIADALHMEIGDLFLPPNG